MKNKWPFVIILILLIALIATIRHSNNGREGYKIELAKKDSIINIQKHIIDMANEQIKQDSIAYEKEKQHIKILRNRYPNNAFLDSLLRAGQQLR